MPLLAQTDYRNEFSVADTVFAQDVATNSDNWLRQRLDRVTDDPLLQTVQLGMMVYDLTDQRPLYRWNERYRMRPASVEKVITSVTALDMLGTDLVPPRRNREYLFAIGENTLPPSYQGYLSYICARAFYKLDLDLSFYGSRTFYKMMEETSDQYPFARAGIPAILFTSAFHEHTYKKTDTPAIIDYPLLRKRTMAIFNFINRLCAEN